MSQIPDTNRFEVPREVAQCPECGGAIVIEVLEWHADNGQPTEGGCYLTCETESEEDAATHHEHDHHWHYVQMKVENWAFDKVRVPIP